MPSAADESITVAAPPQGLAASTAPVQKRKPSASTNASHAPPSSPLAYWGRQFEDAMIQAFYRYGELVGRYPAWFVVVPVLFTIACLPGLFFVKIDLDLYRLFVPLDAPVRSEFERTIEYNAIGLGTLEDYRMRRDATNEKKDVISHKGWKKRGGGNYRHDILRYYVVHKNFENLLDPKYLSVLWTYTNEMMGVRAVCDGQNYTFEAFCQKEDKAKKCSNQLNIWLKHADVLFRDGKVRNNPNLQLSYPVMYLFNRPKDIGNVIYGVNVTGEKNEIVGARVLTLHWFIRFPSNNSALSSAYNCFREKLLEFWKEREFYVGLEFIPHNEKAMDDEMQKIIETTVPFAIPTTIMLMLFVLGSNWSSQKHKSKPMEMWMGVLSVIMALLCTFGIFFFLGFKFNPVTSTMPFLIMAVGVDDDFLMIGTWRQLNRRLSVEKRIALTMAEAGASITVTSFTNFGCFALGYFMCSTPAVAAFCLITAWGVIFDYIMQITFFGGILVYSGRKEDTGGLGSCCYKTVQNTDEVVPAPDANQAEQAGAVAKRKSDDEGSEPAIDLEHFALMQSKDLPFLHVWFRDKFTPFILRRDVTIVSWILFCIYAVVAFYGCCIIKVDISPTKYIRDNSPIQTFVRLADKYIWADNVMPTFHVMRPPDLRDAGARTRLNQLIFQLENTKYSVGRVSTNFWVWQYQQYLNDFPEVNYKSGFYDRHLLADFFEQIDYQQYRDKVKIADNVTNGEPCITAFSFQTSFYGLDSWDKRQAELFHWREILHEYPDLDVFLSGIFSPFLIDQRRTIAPSSMQTIGSALVMMALISFFFLPDSQSVFFMTWSLLSISMGVCGGLAILGSDLDSVSMGCIVMAIGLAVDYSVHICYRYHRSDERRAKAKVVDSLAAVGWPVCQAVLSTLVGLAVLPLVPAYLVRVFFQTVYLVNIIGILHALVWLPQLISALDPCERRPLRFREALTVGDDEIGTKKKNKQQPPESPIPDKRESGPVNSARGTA